MSLAPRGMSVQEAYRNFLDGTFVVNRRYQRKLVWTKEEKQKLIDSVLLGYPIPLFLLAEPTDGEGLEIVDGIQRLNAIFSFIHHRITTIDGQCFDIGEFARAKQAAEQGAFDPYGDEVPRLSKEQTATFLDYQLAVTIDTEGDDARINDVFGRINSGGRQLSFQEKRQAGLVSDFAEMVRELACELRGDTSPLKVKLLDMPSISINTPRDKQSYGIDASEVFWSSHGIISANELRDSVDEQLVADLAISVLYGEPVGVSREKLDDFYSVGSADFDDLEARLKVHGVERLKNEFKVVVSQIRDTLESPKFTQFKNLVHENSANSARTAFYAVFMAHYDLVFRDKMLPADRPKIIGSLENLQRHMARDSHYPTSESRKKNVDLTKGLVQGAFVKGDVAELGSSAALSVDFENSLRMSRFERNRYEFKVGRVRLSGDHQEEPGLLDRVIETMCGIANIGPDADGFVYFGVADNEAAAARVKALYGVDAQPAGGHFVTGIDHDLAALSIDLETYMRQILAAIQASSLSDPLKTNIIASISHGEFKGRTFVRIRIPRQKDLSSVGDTFFIRTDSNTLPMDPKQAVSQAKLFT